MNRIAATLHTPRRATRAVVPLALAGLLLAPLLGHAAPRAAASTPRPVVLVNVRGTALTPTTLLPALFHVPAGQKVSSVAPLVTGIAFGANTGYLNIPATTYSLAMLAAGTIPSSTALATYSGPQVTYSTGAARTIILIDPPQASTPGIRVITANDFDPPGTVD